MAGNTMDAIKKKMQAMKLEKENAMEKSDEMEQKLQEQKDANEKVGVWRHLSLHHSYSSPKLENDISGA